MKLKINENENRRMKVVIKENANTHGRKVVKVSMDVEVPEDFTSRSFGRYGEGVMGDIERVLNKYSLSMAGDFMDIEADLTDIYAENGYFDYDDLDIE